MSLERVFIRCVLDIINLYHSASRLDIFEMATELPLLLVNDDIDNLKSKHDIFDTQLFQIVSNITLPQSSDRRHSAD